MLKRLRQLLCLAGFGLLGCLLFVPYAKAETSAEVWQATTMQACQTLFGMVVPSSTESMIDESTATSTEEVVDDDPKEESARLEMISANPIEGQEWIELSGAGSYLVGWHLEDAVGKIYTFTSSSLEFIDATSSRLRITLSSSRLNNSGDSVILKNGDVIIDQTTFGEINKDQLWMRSPTDSALWELSPANLPIKVDDPVAATSTEITVAQLPPKVVQSKTVLTTAKAKTTPNTSAKPPTKTTTTKSSSKVAAAAKSTAPVSVSFSMLPSLESGTRVSLVGIVANLPKLIGAQKFVIQNPDGRGLLVESNTKQPSPDYQTVIEVTGTLTINDNGISLRMLSADRWRLIPATEHDVTLRTVDLTAPAKEDAWSLIEVTGTVRSVQKTFVQVDTEDASLRLVIRPAVKYRPERLEEGDIIKVKGILDTRGDTPSLYPRTANEIQLIEHVKKVTKNPPPTSSFPAWAPFGAAGATIAVTHGVKRLKKLREKKRLATLLAQATKNLTQSHPPV